MILFPVRKELIGKLKTLRISKHFNKNAIGNLFLIFFPALFLNKIISKLYVITNHSLEFAKMSDLQGLRKLRNGLE